MIPQPVKWIVAILALVGVVAVAAPMAYDAILGMVTFSDDGGLISGGDDDEDSLDDDGEGEAAGGTEDEGEPTEDPPDSYEVQAGDTLFSIAAEVYGEGSRWPEIAEANDIDLDDDESISAGQELVIP